MQTADDILSDHFIAVTPEISVGKAIEQMIEEQTTTLLVVTPDNQLVGTLKDGTTLRAAMDAHLRHDPVSLHTTRHIASVSSEAPVDFVLEHFVLHDLHFIPVVGADKRVVGVIARADLLQAVFGATNAVLGPNSL